MRTQKPTLGFWSRSKRTARIHKSCRGALRALYRRATGALCSTGALQALYRRERRHSSLPNAHPRFSELFCLCGCVNLHEVKLMIVNAQRRINMAIQSVSNVARKLGVAPKLISDLFYTRVLNDDKAPVLSGRRVIPESYVETIREELIKRGKLNGASSDAD